MAESLEHLNLDELLSEMEVALQDFQNRSPVLIAIQTGGLWIAERLHKALNISDPLGSLDISFYRDDYSTIGVNPQVHGSYLPNSIDDRHIILIDDILHTGRTVRAALNELFAWGRPSSVTLAVLFDRGSRELPFQPDVVGSNIHLSNDQFVKVTPNGEVILTTRGD